MDAARRIIVPLDVDDSDEALAVVRRLRGRVGMFKVGLELFCAAGPTVVGRISDLGEKVFLDLKLHDIPNTVGRAAAVVAALGAEMLTVHISGGARMIRAAAEAIGSSAPPDGKPPLLLGVTVLTSFDQSDLESVGIRLPLSQQVLALARTGRDSGLDGVVASPHEAAAIKAACGSGFLVVTPGIRPSGSAPADQRRVMTPREAVAAGADFLVIGRPITAAPDPAEAVDSITREISG